ncbi:zinc finger protein 81 [Bombyx mori]|uniref:Uncharacterized protein n=1 Tax=Bombyx mori TaxID=7091 RepID=A0A8R2C5H2_BOMMO|nr:zinc finger protein 81 [Bombyx mori]
MTWNSCRTCLSIQNLNPIFPMPEHHEKYTNVILSTTGVKVELNDEYPQVMCTSCIQLINDSYKFRKKCEQTQQILQSSTHTRDGVVKTEMQSQSDATYTFIDISDLIIDLDTTNANEDETNTSIEEEKKLNKKKEKVKKKEKKDVKVKEKIECEHCHKILTSKLSLRNHYKIHTGFDVVCEHCGKKFITRRLLLMHCRAKHGYEKTDKCSYCDYRASNAEQVKIHERLHTGERPFVCAQCGAAFHRRSTHLQHVATHLPDRPVPCPHCPARFQTTTLMRIHRSRHAAPPARWRCALCEGRFARRRTALRHLLRAHALQDPALLHKDTAP